LIALPPNRRLEEEDADEAEDTEDTEDTEEAEDSDFTEDMVFIEETDFTEGRDWTEGSDLLDILVAEDLREVIDVDLIAAAATGTATATGANDEVATGTAVCKRRVSRDFLAKMVLGAARAMMNARRRVNLFILMLAMAKA
jgi:hypothetical protein